MFQGFMKPERVSDIMENRELYEVYTKHNRATREAFLKLKEDYSQCFDNVSNWEQGARLVMQNNDRNILVELDFPTGATNSDGLTWLCAYEFEGRIEDYMAEDELMCEEYKEDYTSVYEDMKRFALKVLELD